MSQSTSVIRQLSLQTDEAALYKNLEFVFSDKTKVLAEMIQNCRRAGATAIHFTMEGSTLVIEDNGQGIHDLQALLKYGRSDWSQQLIDEERSFGAGFLSSLYAAKQVKVESRGKMCLFDTDSLIAMKKVDEYATDYIGNTRITFIDFALTETKTLEALNAIVKGFPVPVFFNENELQRPHALDQQSHIVEMDIGQGVLINSDCESSDFYYQGLPIKSPFDRRTHWSRNIIHLNNSFAVRTPDRDSLINPEEEAPVIHAATAKAWIANLENLKQTLSPELFVLQFDNLQVYGLLHLLNDIDIVPAKILRQITDYPSLCSYGGFTSQSVINLSRKSLDGGAHQLVYHLDRSSDGHDGLSYAVMTMMQREGWFSLTEELHPEHWVYQFGYAIDMDMATIAVERAPAKASNFSFDAVSGTLELVDEITIRINDHVMRYKDMNVGLSEGEGNSDFTLIVTNNADDVLKHVNSYCQNDDYREEWFDEDSIQLRNLIAVLNGECAEATILKSMQAQYLSLNTNCVNTASVLVIQGRHDAMQVSTLESILIAYATHLGQPHDEQSAKAFLEQLQQRQRTGEVS